MLTVLYAPGGVEGASEADVMVRSFAELAGLIGA
jgi:hypothetical protein